MNRNSLLVLFLIIAIAMIVINKQLIEKQEKDEMLILPVAEKFHIRQLFTVMIALIITIGCV